MLHSRPPDWELWQKNLQKLQESAKKLQEILAGSHDISKPFHYVEEDAAALFAAAASLRMALSSSTNAK